MSSILDALRKLEQEKAVRERTDEPVSVRELTLEPEFGDDSRHAGPAPLKAVILALGALLVVVGIGAGLIAAGTMVARHDTPVQRVVATAPAPQKQLTTTVKPVQVAANAKVPVPSAPTASAVPPPKPAPAKKPDPPAAPKSAAPPVAPAVKPAPPVAPPAAPAAVPAKEAPAAPVGETDIDKLPILSESVRVRLGLPPLKINIVGIPNSRNPRASALINMQKVYVGETVPGTSARLLDVNLRGVSLDINGQRYFLSRR